MDRIARFLGLDPAERGLLLRAGLLVAIVRMALTFLPFRTVQRKLASWATRVDPNVQDRRFGSVEEVVWSVRAASRYVPAATCLTQALAARALLDRRGLPNDLRIGVARNGDRGFEAHAWIESDGEVVLGDIPDLRKYTPLAARERTEP